MLQAFILSITLISGAGSGLTKYDAVCFGGKDRPASTYQCEFGEVREGQEPRTCESFRVVDVSIPHTMIVQTKVKVSCKEFTRHIELGLDLEQDPKAPLIERESVMEVRPRIVFDEPSENIE